MTTMIHPLLDSLHVADVVILANGDYPTHPIPVNLLHQAKRLLCCDQAGEMALHDPKLTIEAVVGDGDSLSMDLRNLIGSRFIHIEEQEDNDLTKATRYAISHLKQWGIDEKPTIIYLGATGKREDHTLANISLMMRYHKEMNIKPVMVTDYGWFIPVTGDAVFESFPGQQVSLFNFSCTELSGEGLKWAPYATTQLWQGSLNEALDHQFAIHANGYYLVYRTFEKK